MRGLGRIGDRRAPNLGKRGESVNLTARSAHDVLRANSANKQGVSDKRPMAAPRHSFSAHQGDLILLSRLDRFFEALHKLARLHVIGIASKGGISPACVGRIAPGMAKAAKTWHVDIFQADSFLDDRANESLSNCGLCAERGTVRTSTTQVAPCTRSRWMNSSIERVE